MNATLAPIKANFTKAAGFLVLLGAAMIASPAAALTPAQQAGLDLGVNNNYIFVDLGATNLGWNSGPLDGDVLFGLGLTVKLSGGNNGGLSNGGKIQHDSTTTISGSLQNQPSQAVVANSLTQSAATIAKNVSDFAASLAPTQNVGTTITGTTTITGNGDLNVIDVTDVTNAKLTLNGTANDYFVFNISHAVMTNQAMTLTGGVLASHILFNLTNNTGTVATFQTSGGDLSYGTYLATNGGNFQFSNLNLFGKLINTGGDVQLVSGSAIHAVPEPGTLGLVGIGAIALACVGRASRRRHLGKQTR